MFETSENKDDYVPTVPTVEELEVMENIPSNDEVKSQA